MYYKIINVLTCSSLIMRGRSWDVTATSSNCVFKILVDTGGNPTTIFSVPVVSPPSGLGHPSMPKQLLSADAGKGEKSEAKESFSSGVGVEPVAGMRGADPVKSGETLRITPALVLLGIHWAKKSTSE